MIFISHCMKDGAMQCTMGQGTESGIRALVVDGVIWEGGGVVS